MKKIAKQTTKHQLYDVNLLYTV